MKRLILVSELHHLAYQIEQKVFQIVCLNRHAVNTKVLVTPEIFRLYSEIDNHYNEMSKYKEEISIALKTDGGSQLIFR